MTKSYNVCLLLFVVVTSLMMSMINSQEDIGAGREERVEIINISCDSSCSTCASLNSFYFETEDNVKTDNFAVMGKPTRMTWEGKRHAMCAFKCPQCALYSNKIVSFCEVYMPNNITSTEVDLKFVMGTDMYGFPLEFPVIDRKIDNICSSEMAVPIDGQDCSVSGNYLFSMDFTVPPNPLGMPLSGLELAGPATMKNIDSMLANCTVNLVLE